MNPGCAFRRANGMSYKMIMLMMMMIGEHSSWECVVVGGKELVDDRGWKMRIVTFASKIKL